MSKSELVSKSAIKNDLFTNAVFQKVLVYLNREETRKQFQEVVLDPILKHVLEKVFPYMILICVLFILLLVVVIITLSIMIFQIRSAAGRGSSV